MKLKAYIAALILTALLMQAQEGHSRKVSLTDADLGGIVGQAGIVSEETSSIDSHADVLHSGALMYSDMDIKGTLTTRGVSPEADLTAQKPRYDVTSHEVTGEGVSYNEAVAANKDHVDATITINSLSYGDIRLGADTASASLGAEAANASFGSIDLRNAVITVRGSAPVTQHF